MIAKRARLIAAGRNTDSRHCNCVPGTHYSAVSGVLRGDIRTSFDFVKTSGAPCCL
ncbi:MAG: hypothetical protein QOE48_4559 [Mycobacterium sp.]|jgi:hypothetical protein|nr:hypothetical protein [Mycobacterium sp.]